MKSSHHTGYRDRILSIGNNQHRRFEFPFIPVNRYDNLSRSGFSDNNLSSDKPVMIERMKRMAQFQEHIVGGIDHIIDRIDPAES